MNFDLPSLNSYLLIAVGFAAAFVAALWLSLIIWTFKDIRRRSRDSFTRILAVFVVAILFLPGIIIYLILRPSQTLEEEYQQTLEEEALLQTIEDIPLCPGCGRHVNEKWVVCPSCNTRLKKRCHQCGQLMELPWNLCPFCATAVPGMRKENISLDEALQPIPTDDLQTNDDEFDEFIEEVEEH